MSRNLIGLLVLSLAVPIAAAQMSTEKPLGPVSSKGLSVRQAAQVLLLVLKHEGYNPDIIAAYADGQEVLKPKKRYNPESAHGLIAYFKDTTPPHPGYLDFLFSYDNDINSEYIAIFFKYSVSKLTGDVWEVHQCKRYAFPALQDLQKSIMQQTGKTMADEDAQRKGLGCTDDANAPTLDLGPVSPQGLSPHQAGEMLKLFLIHDGYKPPIYWEKQILRVRNRKAHFKHIGFYIRQFKSRELGYWSFDLRRANSKSGDFDFYGSYSVSKVTGNILPTYCDRYIFPALQRAQESIMKQTGKTMADEKAQTEKLQSCPAGLLY